MSRLRLLGSQQLIPRLGETVLVLYSNDYCLRSGVFMLSCRVLLVPRCSGSPFALSVGLVLLASPGLPMPQWIRVPV